METKWDDLLLKTIKFKNTSYLVIDGFDAIEEELDEDFSITGAMIVNPFKGPFEERIKNWNENLLLMSNVVEEWRRL